VSKNKEYYFANSEIHNINTWHTSNLHLPRAHLNIYQKGVYYSVLRFSIVFRGTSKHALTIQGHLKRQYKFLYTNSYSLNEYYENNNIKF
jgi:hypothetical protein